MKIRYFFFLFLTACVSFVGTEPGEPSAKLLVLLGDSALSLQRFDGRQTSIFRRKFYTSPGTHSASFSYRSQRLQSVQDAEESFSGEAGQTVIICTATDLTISKGLSYNWKWGIFPLVSSSSIYADEMLSEDTNATCLLWSAVADVQRLAVEDSIKEGASKEFRNSSGQTNVEFAETRPSSSIVRTLRMNGFQ